MSVSKVPLSMVYSPPFELGGITDITETFTHRLFLKLKIKLRKSSPKDIFGHENSFKMNKGCRTVRIKLINSNLKCTRHICHSCICKKTKTNAYISVGK